MDPQTILYLLLALWCAVVLSYAGWRAWHVTTFTMTTTSGHGFEIGARVYLDHGFGDGTRTSVEITSISANTFTFRL